MLIILTGPIGIGKSTVCRNFVEIMRRNGCACGGIITNKNPAGGLVVQDVQNGLEAMLADTSGAYPGPRIGKYFFSPEGIRFGLEAINRGLSLPFLVLDEIGPLELAGAGFAGAIPLIADREAGNQLVVVRRELLREVAYLIGRTPRIFELTLANRDYIPRQMLRLLAAEAAEPAPGKGIGRLI